MQEAESQHTAVLRLHTEFTGENLIYQLAMEIGHVMLGKVKSASWQIYSTNVQTNMPVTSIQLLWYVLWTEHTTAF